MLAKRFTLKSADNISKVRTNHNDHIGIKHFKENNSSYVAT